jgi:ribonucleoside-diphosphate reductase alpha chain
MSAIQNAAYKASAALAAEKGAFPLYDADAFLERPNVKRLDADTRAAIAKHGIRNGCLTSIAPTGTISLLAGNVSSGIEPVFDFTYRRRVLQTGGASEETVEDFAYQRYRALHKDGELPAAFVRAGELTPAAHLAMQAALQPFVDSAISKTINCPEQITFEAFRDVYAQAYRAGLKGCTTYRPNAITGAVLMSESPTPEQHAGPPAEAAAASSGAPLATQPGRQLVASPQPETRDPAALGSGKAGDVVYLSKPLERDEALEGVTYKIKWPASPHALYVTINDIVRDGRRRPFEIFINTKNLEHYAWTVALTRMISAVFRRGGDVTFVAEELKAVFDPEGGRWMDGRYVPSLLAAIGEIVEEHMVRIGFLVPEGAAPRMEPNARAATARPAVLDTAADDVASSAGARSTAPAQISAGAPGGNAGAASSYARFCPHCGNRSLHRIEGCWTCATCQYSHCG